MPFERTGRLPHGHSDDDIDRNRADFSYALKRAFENPAEREQRPREGGDVSDSESGRASDPQGPGDAGRWSPSDDVLRVAVLENQPAQRSPGGWPRFDRQRVAEVWLDVLRRATGSRQPAIGSQARVPRSRSTLGSLGLGLIVAIAAITSGLLVPHVYRASAATTAAQCNGEMNGGGTQVACTVVISNYLTASGSLAQSPPSTLSMTRCVGASGPVSTLTCTTTVTTLTSPAITVQQCNSSGNGGGGTVRCSVTVANHFSGSPGPILAALIYQCVGSVITGTGAPGICTPANTPGVTSVPAATVGQCNGSGNGGTSVGFVCTVNGPSTMTETVRVNVDQCNGSGNGGGALVTCDATVTNDVIPGTGTPTVTSTASPSTTTPTVTSTASPSTTTTGTPSGTPGTPGTTPSATPGTPSPTTSVTPTPTATVPGTTPTATIPSVAPRPPAAGNSSAGLSEGHDWTLVIAAAAMLAAALAFAAALRSR